MSSQYGQETPPLARKEHFQGRDVVEQQAHRKPQPEGGRAVIFQQHDQVVAVVVVHFSRRSHRERASPQMVDHAVGTVAHPIPPVPQLPAQVDLLHVELKILVEPTDHRKGLLPDCQRGPAGPQQFRFAIVLAVVFFQGVKNPSPAKRIPVFIQVAAAGPGVFEMVRVLVGEHFRLAGGHLRTGVHAVGEVCQPVGLHFDVVVEKYQYLAAGMGGGPVVAAAVAVILVQRYDFDAGIVLAHPVGRSVGGGVVGQQYLEVAVVGMNDAGQKFFQVFQGVPGNDNYTKAQHRFGFVETEIGLLLE